MDIKYTEDREESLIWVKRPTQPKTSITDPQQVNLWPHFIVAINSITIKEKSTLKGDLKYPFGEKNIRKENSEDHYEKLKNNLHIGEFDIKNLWPRFHVDNIKADFQIDEDKFVTLLTENEFGTSLRKFVEFSLKPEGGKSPRKIFQAISGLTDGDLNLIWDRAINIVSMYVYGLSCKSFYGHSYKSKILNSSDVKKSLFEMVEYNENLLKIFAHEKDYAKRGTNDSIAVIHAFNQFCKNNELKLPGESEFCILLFPKSAFLKEISPILSYFDIDFNYLKESDSPARVVEQVATRKIKNTEPTLVILQGPPGTGKTRLAREMSKKLQIAFPRICQFHPSYSYEQFVEGIQPVAFVDGTYKYQPVDGPLLISWRKVTGRQSATLCMKSNNTIWFPAGILPRYFGIGEKFQVSFSLESVETPTVFSYAGQDSFQIDDKPNSDKQTETKQLIQIYLKGVEWGKGSEEMLILDELNRASVPQVFGELMYALSLVDGEMTEADRKLSSVRLQYSQEEFFWPNGLHIVATLNQADRSTDDLDQALQRRFEILNVPPNSSILKSLELDCISAVLQTFGTVDAFVKWLEKSTDLVCSCLSELMDGINETLKNNPSIFDADKKLLGQAIFLKAARVSSKLLNAGENIGVAKQKFISELKAGLMSQMQAICNNNTTLIADVLSSAISEFRLLIPKEVVADILDTLSEDHPLHANYITLLKKAG